MTIRFSLDGIPKAQGRPKARKFGNHAAVYDPGTANAWKARIADAAMPHRPATPLEGPLFVEIILFLPRPKSRCRKCDPDGPIWCPKRPDRDNLDKAVLDILTDIQMWRDDSQVCAGPLVKLYHAKGGRPGARITIRAVTDCEVYDYVSDLGQPGAGALI